MLEECELCFSAFGLDDSTLAAVARISLTSVAAPDDVVADALAGVDAWLVQRRSQQAALQTIDQRDNEML